jgi:hypothetical protein
LLPGGVELPRPRIVVSLHALVGYKGTCPGKDAEMDVVQLAKDHLASLHRERQYLANQLRTSEEAIEQSKELIRQTDNLLARSGLKP